MTSQRYSNDMHLNFDNVPNDLIEFCKVTIGSSIITVLHPGVILQAGIADLIVQYISTFFMWSAWVTTALVGIKTLSGKNNILDAYKYFKNGIINLFKRKK